MSYKLIIKPLAEVDIEESAFWYEEQSSGLGLAFLQEIEQKIQIIENNPNLFEIKYKSIRQAFFFFFSYSIHYIIELETIFVLALIHTNRNPQTVSKRNK